MEQKTPLYDSHIAAGGKIVPFAGYLLPVQYRGVIDEHLAVRRQAGLFDVSHMGEIVISGPSALANINNLFTNDFTNLAIGRVRYSPMCNERGGIVDDFIVYRMTEDSYLVVVNASNRYKDADFMRGRLFGDVTLEDISDNVAQIALQGPKSRKILAKVTDGERIPAKYYSFTDKLAVAGVNCLVSQTGYTGELGYELYCAPQDVTRLWDALLSAGKDDGLIPCGLGARDTLRLEAAMPLYGHEMNDDISPLETGLDFAVKMTKTDFVGKKGMESRGEPVITRAGLKVTGRGIAREHNSIYAGDRKVGETTSGTHCPFLDGAYAMALVEKAAAVIGAAVQIDVRGRKIDAEVIPLPFYKKS